ncbi:MAG: DUF58 domain-containing protein [Spirochaetaceae bacterium]|nr:DUF58 domain-containing protein [Spirochaetaceae bacterium]GMO20744.1 MAG: DUF58 domain-containing protein [Termitinemataceae bacterium]
MERDELLRKINTFPLVAGELARDMLAGDFRSVFRGEGIEFDEVRRYEQGDDVRAIDRNVSARYGTPYIKLYREERELTVFVVLDCSASMFVGSEGTQNIRRIDQAILAAALIAFSAERSGQRFGALFFDNDVHTIFKPKRGRSHIMAFAGAALSSKPKANGSDLRQALLSASRLLKRRSIVVIISDFLSSGWEHEFGNISKKHDCIVCRVSDPLDSSFPNLGLTYIEDPETRAAITCNTASSAFRSAWEQWHTERNAFCASVFRRYEIAHIELSTQDEVIRILKTFFRARKHR